MCQNEWTVVALEKRIAEGERLLEEFTRDRDCFELVYKELDKKQRMLAKLREKNVADQSSVG